MTPRFRLWQKDFERWLEPFLEALHYSRQRHWAPVYLEGLLRPGRRKSIEPMAERVAPGDVQQLHNFVSTARWPTEPVEKVLAAKASALVGGPDAFLIVDDTALVKKGEHSVGVQRQYCGELGKLANCQALVSLTLAREEIPVPISLKLFLPEAWAGDKQRRARAYVPESVEHRPKWKMALEEVDRARANAVEFGVVLADAGYGSCAEFRHGLNERQLKWAVGIESHQKVYAADIELKPMSRQTMGRPRKHREPTSEDRSAREMIESLGHSAWRKVTWRNGTKGPLHAKFACVRVRVADGEKRSQGKRQPGQEVWLIGERRTGGQTKYYLSNLSANAGRKKLASTIKARWACEQAHQQMKQELGLDHFEGRSWHGLHHHALLVMIAYAFLQDLRVAKKKGSRKSYRKATSTHTAGGRSSSDRHRVHPHSLPAVQR